MKDGHVKRALKTLNEALELDPDNAEAQADEILADKKLKAGKAKKQARKEMDSGDFAKALSTLDGGSKLDPDDEAFASLKEEAERKSEGAGLFVCANTEQEMGQLDDAIEKFKQVMRASKV